LYFLFNESEERNNNNTVSPDKKSAFVPISLSYALLCHTRLLVTQDTDVLVHVTEDQVKMLIECDQLTRQNGEL
jgi:hypothetical protein